MAVPVGERIARKLFERLQKLTTGYDQNFVACEVYRPAKNIDNFTPDHLQIVMTLGALEIPRIFPGNPAKTEWSQTHNVYCNINPSEKDETSLLEYYLKAVAAVRSVITEDTDWEKWDKLAINTTFGNIDRTPLEGSFASINTPVTVIYRTDENDLYTARP